MQNVYEITKNPNISTYLKNHPGRKFLCWTSGHVQRKDDV